jgi:hypothetical protein
MRKAAPVRITIHIARGEVAVVIVVPCNAGELEVIDATPRHACKPARSVRIG